MLCSGHFRVFHGESRRDHPTPIPKVQKKGVVCADDAALCLKADTLKKGRRHALNDTLESGIEGIPL
jgi:hypothetical protein